MKCTHTGQAAPWRATNAAAATGLRLRPRRACRAPGIALRRAPCALPHIPRPCGERLFALRRCWEAEPAARPSFAQVVQLLRDKHTSRVLEDTARSSLAQISTLERLGGGDLPRQSVDSDEHTTLVSRGRQDSSI